MSCRLHPEGTVGAILVMAKLEMILTDTAVMSMVTATDEMLMVTATDEMLVTASGEMSMEMLLMNEVTTRMSVVRSTVTVNVVMSGWNGGVVFVA